MKLEWTLEQLKPHLWRRHSSSAISETLFQAFKLSSFQATTTDVTNAAMDYTPVAVRFRGSGGATKDAFSCKCWNPHFSAFVRHGLTFSHPGFRLQPPQLASLTAPERKKCKLFFEAVRFGSNNVDVCRSDFERFCTFVQQFPQKARYFSFRSHAIVIVGIVPEMRGMCNAMLCPIRSKFFKCLLIPFVVFSITVFSR